jgi:outer membrane protein OmpA-like peptidoglycan-associated protein
MIKSTTLRIASARLLSFAIFTTLGIAAHAQGVKLEGVIQGRSGNTMFLKTTDSPKVVVLLTDSTRVAQVQGAFKARKKDMSMAALIPGLPVKVEGTYDAEQQVVATLVKFKGNDFEQAQAIQAGVHETAKQSAANQSELEKQNALLKEQNDALQQQQAQLTEQQKKIAANKAAIEANTARFGQLDDYYIYDEVTVLFANGKVKVDPQYNAPLLALADKAKTVNGYMIQVKGYASASGSAAVNQKLSEQRAASVTTLLQQQGHVPLTNMLAPGAMGESRQVPTDKAVEGEAQNRRVVVRVLQNKGIAGIL